MKFEQPNLNVEKKEEAPQKVEKKEEAPQKLEDTLPYIKPSKEEVEYASNFKKTTDEFTKLMKSGKMDEAIAMAKSLGKGPEREDFTEKEMKDFTEARAKLAQQLGYKVVSNQEKFLTLEKDGYTIQMKHFMLPSGSGYNNGRISEMQIEKGKKDYVWDNGWDKKPKDEETNKIVNEIVNYFG
jgi:soluble cytochrome b562